jgi:hypothetical protein
MAITQGRCHRVVAKEAVALDVEGDEADEDAVQGENQTRLGVGVPDDLIDVLQLLPGIVQPHGLDAI